VSKLITVFYQALIVRVIKPGPHAALPVFFGSTGISAFKTVFAVVGLTKYVLAPQVIIPTYSLNPVKSTIQFIYVSIFTHLN